MIANPAALWAAGEQGLRPPGAPPWTSFLVLLGVTVVFLGLDIVTGRTGRRRAHVVCVGLTVPLLATSIYFAERVGSYWSFPRTSLGVHLTFAYLATAALVVAATSGVLHITGKIARRRHAALAWVFLILAACAVGTGTWIFLVGEPL